MIHTIFRLRRLGLRQFNRILWVLRASALPRGPDGKLMLHVGCGDIDAAGYVNVDARKRPHVHFRIEDLRDIDFVPPNSIDLVYMCHVLEHVRHPEVGSVLRAAHRILRPGATLRLAVPDFDHIVEIYERTDRDIDAILAPLMGGQDYPQNTHFVAFNAESLTRVMLRCGFGNVRVWDAGQVEGHDFDDTANMPCFYSGRSHSITLNLEATRV